jgi:hypothetical protein
MGKIALQPRTAAGRFVKTACPDVSCDGRLRPDRDGWWRCDGLTHRTDGSPLFDCAVSFHPHLDETPC